MGGWIPDDVIAENKRKRIAEAEAEAQGQKYRTTLGEGEIANKEFEKAIAADKKRA
jgi:hypothetical protein